MSGPHEPIALGGVQSVSVRTDAAIVDDVWFPAGSVVPWHTHERTIVGVMLDGSFQSSIAGRQLDCRVGAAWVEPRAERHANFVGRSGARVLAIQPDDERDDLFAPLLPWLADVHLIDTADLRVDARRLARELRSAEPFNSLAIDSLVVLMLADASRLTFRERHHGAPPGWLLRVRDLLHAQFTRPPRLEELSQVAGVSPSHLTHSFRRHFRVTPGEYVRQVRVNWAADQLVTTQRSLSEIALAAGYCDQSHFSREVRRTFGIAPAQYRRTR